MKKVLFCISMLFCLSVSTVFAGDKIPMTHMPAGSTHDGSTKSPVNLWYIDLTDNIITMSATPCDYTLSLFTAIGNVTVPTMLGSFAFGIQASFKAKENDDSANARFIIIQ